MKKKDRDRGRDKDRGRDRDRGRGRDRDRDRGMDRDSDIDRGKNIDMVDTACMASFRYISLMSISFRSQKSMFHFEAKFFASFFALFRLKQNERHTLVAAPKKNYDCEYVDMQ
jgi:hypothetical protein